MAKTAANVKIDNEKQDIETIYLNSQKSQIAKDFLNAYHLLVAAAEKGHVEALYDLCRMYSSMHWYGSKENKSAEYLQALKVNLEKYFKQLKGMADNGDANAQVAVGKILKKGGEIFENSALAVQYFEKAALQKLPEGLYQYGYQLGFNLYEFSERKAHYTKEEQRSFELLKEAAEKGCIQANLDVYRCYQNGIVVPPNGRKAFSDYLCRAYELSTEKNQIASYTTLCSKVDALRVNAFYCQESDANRYSQLMNQANSMEKERIERSKGLESIVEHYINPTMSSYISVGFAKVTSFFNNPISTNTSIVSSAAPVQTNTATVAATAASSNNENQSGIVQMLTSTSLSTAAALEGLTTNSKSASKPKSYFF